MRSLANVLDMFLVRSLVMKVTLDTPAILGGQSRSLKKLCDAYERELSHEHRKLLRVAPPSSFAAELATLFISEFLASRVD